MQHKQLKAKTRHLLASEYGIDRKTLYRWLKQAGLQVPPGIICPLMVEKIYGIFGDPIHRKTEKSGGDG